MHIPWEDLRLFLAVAKGGSVTQAASRLGITQPTASRRLLELEAALGEALFERSPLGTTLTSFGERLLEPAKRMEEWACEAEQIAERAQTCPSGLVRVTAPPGIAYSFVAPFAASLRTQMPEITLEVLSTVTFLDLARREADLALRFQAPTQRELVSLASVEFEVFPYASAEYVAALGKHPKLEELDFIAWAPPHDDMSPGPELRRLIPGFRPSFTSDDFIVQLRAAMAGLGVIFLGDVQHRFSDSCGLVEVPIQLPRRKGSLHLVCAKSAVTVPKIRAVAEAIAQELAHAKTLSGRTRRQKPRKG
jgi:DNA-binding transcriptional LysR family regulator